MGSSVLRRERDREVAGALADLGRAAHGARAEPLERRALVGLDRGDAQVVAEQLVVVLGVGDRALEQLAPVLGDVAGGVGEDGEGLLDGLAADVVADQARLARGGADVLGVGADDDALRRRAGVGLRRRGLGPVAGAGPRGRGLPLARRRLLGGLGLLLADARLLGGGRLGLRRLRLARRRGLLGRTLLRGLGLDLGVLLGDGLLGALGALARALGVLGARLVLLGGGVVRR